MGMFDALNSQQYVAPNFSYGDDSDAVVNNYLQRKQVERDRQAEFEKGMMQFQSNLRMNEIANQMHMQQEAARQEAVRRGPLPNNGMNVVFKDYIDPYKQALLNQGSEKIGVTRENNEERNRIAAQNADTRADAVALPNLTQMKTQGGNVSLFDKKTGKVTDTGVTQGTQTGAEKAASTVALENTKETNRESLEAKKQEGRTSNIKSRGEQIIKQIQERGKEARETKGTASPNAPKDLPSQQLVADKLRANQFIQSNPELGKFVTIDPNTGLINIAQPGTGGAFGRAPSTDQYQQILDAIYPKGMRTSVTEGPQKTGSVRIKLQDGRTGTWDLSKGPVPKNATVIGGGQ